MSIKTYLLTRSSMTTLKTCFKCGEAKERTEFYRHAMMADKLLGKCKTCTKADVARNRIEHLDDVRLYDRMRAPLPHRVELRRRVGREWRAAYPERAAAQVVLRRAVIKGFVLRWPRCAVPDCEDRQLEAHHPDYSRPLDVVWLCVTHHRQTHALLAAA